MKAFVYSCRSFDEEPMYRRFAAEMGIDLETTDKLPSLENAKLAEGSDFISILTNRIPPELEDVYKRMGIKLLVTRTIGYDHIDIAHAHEIGLPVAHVTYDTSGVAEYTVMLIMMALRKWKEMEIRSARNNFSLKGLLGGEVSKSKIGIIGAGTIGINVLKFLSGFGGELFYCNRSPSLEADRYAKRLSFDELLAQCDVISLHLEHNKETHHIIDASAFAKMKDGAVFVNTARGPLVDSGALLNALDSGKVSVAALDVIEGELPYYYRDCSNEEMKWELMEELRKRPNAIVMHHMGFYYEQAISDMVRNSLIAMKAAGEGKDIPLRL